MSSRPTSPLQAILLFAEIAFPFRGPYDQFADWRELAAADEFTEEVSLPATRRGEEPLTRWEWEQRAADTDAHMAGIEERLSRKDRKNRRKKLGSLARDDRHYDRHAA